MHRHGYREGATATARSQAGQTGLMWIATATARSLGYRSGPRRSDRLDLCHGYRTEPSEFDRLDLCHGNRTEPSRSDRLDVHRDGYREGATATARSQAGQTGFILRHGHRTKPSRSDRLGLYSHGYRAEPRLPHGATPVSQA